MAGRLQEMLVVGEDRAVRLELDNGVVAGERLDQAGVITLSNPNIKVPQKE